MTKLKTYILTIEEEPGFYDSQNSSTYIKKIKAKSLTEAKKKLLKK